MDYKSEDFLSGGVISVIKNVPGSTYSVHDDSKAIESDHDKGSQMSDAGPQQIELFPDEFTGKYFINLGEELIINVGYISEQPIDNAK